jgi:hypothetical protein
MSERIKCPACGTTLPINPAETSLACTTCGAVLKRKARLHHEPAAPPGPPRQTGPASAPRSQTGPAPVPPAEGVVGLAPGPAASAPPPARRQLPLALPLKGPPVVKGG